MLQVALGWELYERTGSAFALGLVGLATALPVVILALPAGDLADRMDRKRILVWCQIAFTVAGFALAALSHWRGPIAIVYVVLLARGAAQAFKIPRVRRSSPSSFRRRFLETPSPGRAAPFRSRRSSGRASAEL